MGEDVDAGTVRQRQVKDDEVRRPSVQRTHRLLDAGRLVDIESLALQAVSNESADRYVVFHHEDAHQPGTRAAGRASDPSADRTAARRAPSLNGLWMIVSLGSRARWLPKTSLL